jgi:cytochrome c-type biogenesis protein CcmE
MRGLKKQRRIQMLALAGASMLGVLAILWCLPDDAFQYFRSPSEVVETPPNPNELFRIGGLVEDGSLVRGEGTIVRFTVTDGGASVPVTYDGILPDLFEENQGMVGQGRLVNGTFQAVEILAKHDETYMPKEVIEALKVQGVYQPADGGSVAN